MKVLVIDDERSIGRLLALTLETEGHEACVVQSGASASRQVSRSRFDMVFLDLRLGSESGLDVLSQLQRLDPTLPVVVITAYASVETAVAAIRQGAADYLTKPFTPAQIRVLAERVGRARRLEERVAELESLVQSHSPEVEFRSAEPVMQEALDLALKAAPSQASILLLGESGTGKSVLARLLHRRSPRGQRAFVTVNCPSLSRELFESELFGHVKGAFTGAVADTVGKVGAAAEGSLYLDEVGELPLEVQPKLLRLLQEREYERVGETLTRHADVRVISSTNRDLEKGLKEGRFREDLFYRLNTIVIRLPSLRERPRDLDHLAESYLRFFAAQTGKNARGFSPSAWAAIRQYPWPGNLRELRNVIERAVILTDNQPWVDLGDLPDSVRNAPPRPELLLGARVSLARIEEEHIRRVLTHVKRLDEAAEILGIDPATLYRKRRRSPTGLETGDADRAHREVPPPGLGQG